MNTKFKAIVNKIINNVKEHIVKYSIIAGLIITVIVGNSIYRNRIHALETKNEVYVLREQMANQKMDSIKNASGKIIQRQQSLITNNQDAINTLSAESFDLKKKDEKNLNTIALLKTKTEFRADTLKLVYHDTIPINIANKDSAALVKYIEDSTITVPRKADVDSPYISIYQTITKSGVKIDSLKAQDSLIQRVVQNTNGWFKPDTYEFQSFHTNPLFKDKAKQSLIFVPKEKGSLIKYVISALVGAGAVILLKH